MIMVPGRLRNWAFAVRDVIFRSPGLAILLLAHHVVLPAQAEVRIKDITTIEGERTNFIFGTGLVVGLEGTGGRTNVTREFGANLLTRLGNRIDPALRTLIATNTQFRTNNMSVVYVSADLPVNAVPGQTIDALVSTIDDATSLRGGQLVMTPLSGPDGKVYATAAGALTLGGGFAVSGDAAKVSRSHPTTGFVAGKAIVELETPIDHFDPTCLRLLLTQSHADWDTARRITEAINGVAPNAALTENSNSVFVQIPPGANRASFIATVTQLPVEPDSTARVTINERTGTVIIGSRVRLSPEVAISHGSLTVVTGETPLVSQPLPWSRGETTVVPRTEIDVVEQERPITMLDGSVTVGDLVAGLNALGVTPGDLSAIFQQLQNSGYLHATVEFR